MARILVIDDDIQFLSFLQEVLFDEGYSVEVSTNGKEGMQRLEQVKFDILIIDMFMPDKDGVEVLREIRQKKIALKIIGISGGGRNYSADGVLKIAKILGAEKNLHKPFTKKDLLPVIRELLA